MHRYARGPVARNCITHLVSVLKRVFATKRFSWFGEPYRFP